MLTRVALVSALLFSGVACKKKDAPAADPKPTESKTAEPPQPDPKPADPEPAAAKTGLAAIAIPQARTALPDVLTGGQPTDEHLKQAKEQGVKVIVNLRSDGEKAEFESQIKLAEELGIKYVHIPIDGKTGEGLNEDNAKKLAELLAGDKPVLLHCASGQRVGALVALKAFYVDKAAPEAALQLGTDNGLSKPELVQIVTDLINKKG